MRWAIALLHLPPAHTPFLSIQTDQRVCELIGEQWAFLMSGKEKLALQSHSVAHPELHPRQRLEKLGAIIEYANAPGPLSVSVGVAVDEIRAEALIWDADGSHSRHLHKVQRPWRVCAWASSNQKWWLWPVMYPQVDGEHRISWSFKWIYLKHRNHFLPPKYLTVNANVLGCRAVL